MKAVPMLRLRALALSLPALLACGMAFASPDLARRSNCVACHHAERHGIGPAFSAIAGRYAGDPDAVATLSQRIVQGSGGVWGPTPMPPQPIPVEDAQALTRWILARP
jgi:cytochrome c